MINRINEEDSPKDVDFKILQNQYDGLFYFTDMLIEIIDESIHSDLRHVEINGRSHLEVQKEKINKLFKLYSVLDEAIKEFNLPKNEVIPTFNLILERVFSMNKEIRKTPIKGSPPKLRNKIASCWAITLNYHRKKIEWELTAQLLEWLHIRFKNSPWENMVKSKKEDKENYRIDIESLQKHYQRFRKKYEESLLKMQLIFILNFFKGLYSIEFDRESNSLNAYNQMGVYEDDYIKVKKFYESQYRFKFTPIKFQNKKILLFDPNPAIIIFPNRDKLYLLDHIKNIEKIAG